MSRGHTAQVLHILYEIVFQIVALGSRILNGIRGGSMHQTLSAGTHVEAQRSRRWAKFEKLVNRFFLIISLGYNKEHCKGAREDEIKRALKTLAETGTSR